MKQIAIIPLVIALTGQPALAQEQDTTDTEEGFSLMEEGARLFMRGIMSEMEPALDEMRQSLDELGPAFAEFAQAVGPAFAELLDTVDDIRNYDAPEILPNGDIIIRRSPDAPIWEPDPDTGDVEL
ncbi:AAA+ family ATPase [Yoonia litorea]|nr:AAA+ family ATPase [Yoonia litorea]